MTTSYDVPATAEAFLAAAPQSAFIESAQVDELYAAIVEAFGHLANVATDSEADTGKYVYRYMSLGSIMRAVRGPLSAAGLAIVQAPATVSTNGGKEVEVTTRLLHRSGQWMEAAVAIAVGRDAGAQVIGSAITYARRYGLTALLGIASGDDDDGAAANGAPPAYATAAGASKVTAAQAKGRILEAFDGDRELAGAFWRYAIAESLLADLDEYSVDGIETLATMVVPVWKANAAAQEAGEAPQVEERPEGTEPPVEATEEPVAAEGEAVEPSAPPMPPAAVLGWAELEAMTVAQLREALREQALTVTGSLPDLRTRLAGALGLPPREAE